MSADRAAALELELLSDAFAVARLAPTEPLPGWATTPAELVCVTRTTKELSIVAPTGAVPDGIEAEGPWRALKVAGPLSFELVGVLAGLSKPLADAGVSVFAISTHDTDYLLVRAESTRRAIAALRRAGHSVNPPASER